MKERGIPDSRALLRTAHEAGISETLRRAGEVLRDRIGQGKKIGIAWTSCIAMQAGRLSVRRNVLTRKIAFPILTILNRYFRSKKGGEKT